MFDIGQNHFLLDRTGVAKTRVRITQRVRVRGEGKGKGKGDC